MRTFLVYSNEPNELKSYVPEDINPVFFHNEKTLKKTIRSKNPPLVMIHISSENDINIAIKIGEYVRQGLNNKLTWLRILFSQSLIGHQATLTQDELFNDLLVLSDDNLEMISQSNQQLLTYITNTEDLINSKDAQTRMLTSINRFSQHRQPIKTLIYSYAQSLNEFCGGYTAVMVTPKKISTVKGIHWEIPDSSIHDLSNNDLSAFIKTTMQCKAPKIELLPENLESMKIFSIINKKIGGYIVFPISIYNNNIASIVCFIAEEDLDNTSTTQLNIMRDTSNQLQVILERRFSESKLASQYQRLKETLSELKNTQDQLLHSEKMASVGQMAAGIAHEINNPLAFVIGNFGSLEEYVSTIINMLNLHDQFVASLDKSSDSELFNRVSEMKKESDIDFIINDVKAVVDDSRAGLLRVRDIISDLSSFSRKEALEITTFSVESMVEETLKLLKYEIKDDVTMTHKVDISKSFTSHRGFIQQILTNLLKNANHALEDQADNHNKKIDLSVNQTGDNIIFSISDNGPGIPDTIKNQIFDPFYTTKEIGKGTGLGLSVSYNLAKKLKGELMLNTSDTAMTQFKLVLPPMTEQP